MPCTPAGPPSISSFIDIPPIGINSSIRAGVARSKLRALNSGLCMMMCSET